MFSAVFFEERDRKSPSRNTKVRPPHTKRAAMVRVALSAIVIVRPSFEAGHARPSPVPATSVERGFDTSRSALNANLPTRRSHPGSLNLMQWRASVADPPGARGTQPDARPRHRQRRSIPRHQPARCTGRRASCQCRGHALALRAPPQEALAVVLDHDPFAVRGDVGGNRPRADVRPRTDHVRHVDRVVQSARCEILIRELEHPRALRRREMLPKDEDVVRAWVHEQRLRITRLPHVRAGVVVVAERIAGGAR